MKREVAAKIAIKEIVMWELGGLENAVDDKVDDYEEYEKLLKNHTELVQYLYDEALREVPTHVRFLGKEKLIEIVEKLVKKEGY